MGFEDGQVFRLELGSCLGILLCDPRHNITSLTSHRCMDRVTAQNEVADTALGQKRGGVRIYRAPAPNNPPS